MIMGIQERCFGTLSDGRDIRIFTMKNRNGITASVIEYGGILSQLILPDSNNQWKDVVLGYDDLEGYVKDKNNTGAITGRNAGRIEKARFKLNGVEYLLDQNNGENHIHGGSENGFHKQVWLGQSEEENDFDTVHLSYTSPDGQAGFPGNVLLDVSYTLKDDDSLTIDYHAVPDRDTPINLTHHAYFNLKGAGDGTVDDHKLQILSDEIIENKADFLATGKTYPVKDTPMDFNELKSIGRDIQNDHPQMNLQDGYAFYYIFNQSDSSEKRIARVVEPTTGRCLELETDAPGLFFYSSEHFDGSESGKGGLAFIKRGAFCLEPMGYTDAPNQPNYPSTIIRKGEIYRQTSIFRFYK
jgi:aldose 1-epimerase